MAWLCGHRCVQTQTVEQSPGVVDMVLAMQPTCNSRPANAVLNAFLVPPQLYTEGVDINITNENMAYSSGVTTVNDRSIIWITSLSNPEFSNTGVTRTREKISDCIVDSRPIFCLRMVLI